MIRFRLENPREPEGERDYTWWERAQEMFWEFVLYTLPALLRKLFGGGDEPPRFKGA